MTARPRPGQPIDDFERLSAILGEVHDSFVLLQISNPDIAESIRDAADMVRFVRLELLKRVPAEVDHGQEVGE